MEKRVVVRGFYETVYGNAAFVSGPSAKTAYDVDAGERIPISMVELDRLIRPAASRHD